ncbi:MAG: hypothetical protein M3Y22_07415, partial [Pseudomonadota bacterium]|nr:hypothetical protein [Pseudomonadota bacterium]
SGPHSYVTRSHRTAGQLQWRGYTQPEIDAQFGNDSVRTVTGARGTAFMADTYGIHAGMIPTHAPRLILQAQYSLLPVFAFQYAPLASSGPPSLDPYVNRLLLARQASA